MEVAQANGANTRSQARKQKIEPQLDFCCALAEKMLSNNVDHDGWTVVQVGKPVTQGSLDIVKMEHALEKRPWFTRAWGEKDNDWALVRNEYQKSHCTTPGYRNWCRTFCSCKKKDTM